MKNYTKTDKLTYIALLTALATLLVGFPRVPNGVGGIIHTSDSIIYITAIFFGPLAGAFVGGIGHSFANIIFGPQIFAPWTLVIKAIMGLVVGLIAKGHVKGARKWTALVCGTVILVVAYFVANYFLFDLEVAIASILPLSIQGVAGMVVTVALLPIVNKILGGKRL